MRRTTHREAAARRFRMWGEVEQIGSCLYDKTTKRWYLQFFVLWPGETKKKRCRLYSLPGYGSIDSEAAGVKGLSRIHAELASGKTLDQVLTWYLANGPSNNLFIPFWDRWCEYKEQDVESDVLKPHRLKELRRYETRGYLEFFNEVSIFEVDKSCLIHWIHFMRSLKTDGSDHNRRPIGTRRAGEKTIKNVLGDIAQFLRWLKDEGHIDEVPTIPYDKLQIIEYMPEIPENITVCAILDQIPIERRGIFIARSRMGFRPSEARRLNVADLIVHPSGDLRQSHISLPPRSSKKRKGRMLQLHPELADWIEQHGGLNRFGKEPLFRNPAAWNDQGRWKESSERRTLVAAYEALGIEHIKPNEAGRHFFGTHAVNDGGADIYPVQNWMGHADAATTGRYAKMRAVPIARIIDPKGKMSPESKD